MTRLQPAPRRVSSGKAVVVAALLGAVVFGGYLGYLAWANDSFPSQQQPFANYAEVSSVVFNGSEYAITVTWLTPSYIPEYVQITSSVSDAANSPVCGLNLTSTSSGEMIFLPFGFDGPSEAPTSVTLWMAVKPPVGSEFTIQQTIDNYTARVGDIFPVQLSCNEPASVM